jgi:uncharacterized protein with HEPN domain
VPRSILLRLSDIRDAITGIQNVTAGVAFDGFANSWAMQRAVQRGLEIISEASRHVPDELKALAPDIPWRQIAARSAICSGTNTNGPMSWRRGTSSSDTCGLSPSRSGN